MRSLSIWEKFILLLVVINIPGVLITTSYYFSIDYVPSFDFTALLYLFIIMGVFSLIPVTIFFGLLAYPAHLFSNKWNDFKSKNVFFKRSVFNYSFVWFFSFNVGSLGVFALLYYLNGSDSFRGVFVVLYLNTLGLVWLVYLKGLDWFSVIFLSFFAIIIYFFAFFVFALLNGGYSDIPGVKKLDFSILVVVYYFVSSLVFWALSTMENKRKFKSLALLYLICFVYYLVIYGSFNSYLAKRFLAAENIQVVSQDRNGCKIFIGGGTVEDGACLASEVNLLSNLGDYYLFEKDGARYEVMKEKGIRLIFPAKKDKDKDKKEPDAKADGRVSSPEVVKDSK